MKSGFASVLTAAALGCGVVLVSLQQARADVIPYSTPGTPNSAIYSFTAASSGEVIAYFAGSTAAYDNKLGLLVNGVSTGVLGLDNQTSTIGQSLDLGFAAAGATLTFVLQNLTLNRTAYSDPSLNAAYDFPGYSGNHQHIYSTAYTATSPLLGAIPKGVYVGFEDLLFPNSDYNYNDETFVFTNVATAVATPEPASAGLLAVGLVGLAGLRHRARRAVAAAA